MQTEEGLKFFGLSLENFKNISHKEIEIGGHSILVVGPNGSGKSSLIQALCSPLDSKIIPTEAIKKGEERAKIEVMLGGVMGGQKVKYTLELYFSQGKKNGRLVVLNEQGEAVKAAATFVKSLIGNVSFDITAWLHESSDKKLKMLKQLTGCEIEIDKINKVISEKKAAKKAKKDRIEDLESILKNHGFSTEELEKYSVIIDTASIQEELRNVSKALTDYDGVESKVKSFKKIITENDNKIILSREKIKELEAQIEEEKKLIESIFEDTAKQKANIVKGEEWLNAKERPSSDAINERLGDAIRHNEKHATVKRLSDQQSEMLKFKNDLSDIEAEIEKKEHERMGLISKSQLPIEGLSFTEDQILIDGLPMEEGQQNTARLFDIGVDVAMALNPGLKVIFLHDASLFDKKNLAMVISKAEKKGYQVIAEKVEEGELDVKFTEKEV
jgi:DNA repair exonuclease SbcCD ATPase subunit